jgi:hypothetical protein
MNTPVTTTMSNKKHFPRFLYPTLTIHNHKYNTPTFSSDLIGRIFGTDQDQMKLPIVTNPSPLPQALNEFTRNKDKEHVTLPSLHAVDGRPRLQQLTTHFSQMQSFPGQLEDIFI